MIENIINTLSPGIDEISIEPEKLYHLLGYGKNGIPEYVEHSVKFLLTNLKDNINIQMGYKLLKMDEVDKNQHSITVGNEKFFTDPIIFTRLKKAEYIAVYTATLGNKFSNWVDSFKEADDPFYVYLLDILGSETVETVGDLLHKHVDNIAQKKQMQITNRYSPGHCGWDISEQQKLFSLLPDNFCDIVLTDSSLMLPIKSISGFIGIGSQVKQQDYSCSTCNIKSCYKNKHLNI